MSKKIGTVSVDVDINYSLNRVDRKRGCEWISVNDRLPEESGTGAVATEQEVLLAVYDYPAEGFRDLTGKDIGDVTHWLDVENPNDI